MTAPNLFPSRGGRGSRIRTCDLKYRKLEKRVFPCFLVKELRLISLAFWLPSVLCVTPCFRSGGHHVVSSSVSVSAFESKMIAPPTKITNGRLTKRTVDAASPQSERYVVWDSELKGFGLRVEPSGAKTFLVRYRPKGAGRIGTKRFLTVGRYGIVSPDEARNQAKAILGAVAGGAVIPLARKTRREKQ
jgi:hypothetical protein